MPTRRSLLLAASLGGIASGLAASWDHVFAKRLAVIEPGRIVRGAWQRPGPLARLIRSERVRTVVTLTAINRDDPKYEAQDAVIRETGIEWVIIPMRGSTATIDQMREAADILADPRRQPVFFHCVGGHHRSNLVQAAYRIRHEGWSADRAWREVSNLPWSMPSASADRSDRAKIEEFASAMRGLRR